MNGKSTLAVSAAVSLIAAAVTYVSMQPTPPDPRVRQIAVHAAGDRVAAALADGRVFTWPLAGNATPVSHLVSPGGINDLEFSPNGSRLGVADYIVTGGCARPFSDDRWWIQPGRQSDFA